MATQTAPDLTAAQAGQQKLLDQPGISIERLPMVNSVFDRMATLCVENLRVYSSTPVTFFVNHVGTDHLWDVMDSYEGSIAAILYSPEWDARILVGLDRRFVFALMEVLLGGEGTETTQDDERPFSNVEVHICQAIFEVACKALQGAFSDLAPSTFKVERIETRPDFTIMGRRNSLAIVAKILFQALDHGGQMFVLIPQAALNTIRPFLSRDRTSEVQNTDPKWINQLEVGLKKTEVSVCAILDTVSLSLDAISNFKVGDSINLRSSVGSPVKLISNGIPLFECELGQSDGFFTLRVDTAVQDEDPFKFFTLPPPFSTDDE